MERYAVLVEPRSKAPPRCASRQRRFPPRAEPVAWPLTPSVAAPLDQLRPFGRTQPAEPPGPAPTAVSSKTTASARPGRLPSTSAPSPAPIRPGLTACAAGPTRSGRGFRLRPPIGEDRGCGIFESSPPCSRFCHRGPASDVPSPPEHEAGWLDPRAVKRSDQTPLVDFCNQNNPRAQPRDRPTPGSERRRHSRPSLRWAGRRPPGWG
jgi:hypothetical protein